MIDLITLTTAYIDAWRTIPELVAELNDDPNNIQPYIDRNPDARSLARAVYEQPPGSIALAWYETALQVGEMEAWLHRHQIYLRAQKGQSELVLIEKLVNGVLPSTDERWRICQVMPGVLPGNLVDISRIPDEEGIDYFVITMETKETGDA